MPSMPRATLALGRRERLLSRMPDRKDKAGADGLLNIEAIADSCWHLHTQHRSAWTHEIDLRPYKEPF